MSGAVAQGLQQGKCSEVLGANAIAASIYGLLLTPTCSAEIPVRTHSDCHRRRERHDCRRATGGDHECGMCGVGLTVTSRGAQAALRRMLWCNTATITVLSGGLGLQMALSGVFGTGKSILMIALCPGHNIMP